MKKERGFTLVELLSVIVILSLISVLVGVSVTKMVKESKSDLQNAQIKAIKSAAETWGADNINRLPNKGECAYLTLNYLYNNGLLDENIKDPNTKQLLDGNIKIKISRIKDKYAVPILNYEVNPENVNGCSIMLDWIHTEDYDTDGALDVGDVVTASDGGSVAEEFYVIAEPTNNKVKLLAKYNLNASGTIQAPSETQANNPSAFSSTNYWSSGTVDLNNEASSPIPTGETSIITKAMNYGISLGVIGRLIKIEEVLSLVPGALGSFNGAGWYSVSGCPIWLSSQNFWLGTAYGDEYVRVVFGAGSYLDYMKFNYSGVYGVRPVVEVPLNFIK